MFWFHARRLWLVTALLFSCGTPAGGNDAGASFTLVTLKSGNGAGTITSSPAGIDCGTDCSEAVAAGATLTLSATAGTGSRFVGWTGGGCTGTGACTVTVSSDVTVTAAFALENSLVVTLAGAGQGSVTSSPAGISCGTDCSEVFVSGTAVTLAAAPAAGSTFGGWSGGGCSGTGVCTVTVDAAVMVTATFAAQQFPLTVVTTGTGQGVVTSSPAGIDCGAGCSGSFDQGTSVTLTASPAAGSSFTGWAGGGCAGTGACTTVVSAATAVVATFTRDTTAVTVTRAGTGSGTVSSTPAGIDCGLDCAETWSSGTTVVLSATPALGSSFAGWSGACSGTGPCVLTLSAAANVTATFTLEAYQLTVARAGSGAGTVVSTVPGIDCGLDCLETWPAGTMVTLVASPAVGSTFSGWSGGGCSGTGSCVVTLSSVASVVATFTLSTHVVTVSLAGTGSGTVGSLPSGLSCGTDCTEPFDYGTAVVLTAAPAVGSTFSGWSGGGCSGTGTCTVLVTAATAVTATFTLTTHQVSVARAGTGTGAVTSSPAGLNCGATCSAAFDYGTTLVLTAAPAVGSTFAGWSGDCSGTGTCAVTVSAATSVTATFTLDTYTLTVTRVGTGTGTVSSAPAGINCGADCTEVYSHGTSVVLTATPSGGSGFSGWSGGGCSGTGTCTTTLTAATTVTATFGLIDRIGNTTPYPGPSFNVGNYLVGGQFTVSTPVTLRQLGLVSQSSGPQVRMALYSNVANAPSALLAETAPTTMTMGVMEMNTLGGFMALPAGTYWILSVFSANANVGWDGSTNVATAAGSQPFASALANPYTGSTCASGGGSYNFYLVVH